MSNTLHTILEQYIILTSFLGRTLGPCYEVVLYDLINKDRCIIAIMNNHISGRQIGTPLSNTALSILRDRIYEQMDYCLHYDGLSLNGKELKSCAFFIKSEGELLGLLCINFDDSGYLELGDRLLGLCHPDWFAMDTVPGLMGPEPRTISTPIMQERFLNQSGDVLADAIHQELNQMGVDAERLTSGERMEIIAALEKKGIFLMKGVVKGVADRLHCSQASIYRYLNLIKSAETTS